MELVVTKCVKIHLLFNKPHEAQPKKPRPSQVYHRYNNLFQLWYWLEFLGMSVSILE